MANLSDFFPAAGGGGGDFKRMNKYVTMRSERDATHFSGTNDDQIRVHNVQQSGSSVAVGSTEVTFYGNSPTDATFNTFQDKIDLLIGKTFTRNNNDGLSDGQVYTITSIGARISANASQAVTFTPALTVALPLNHYCTMDLPFSFTVNPATDLGLSDGDSIGYMLVGGGATPSGGAFGGCGGNILMGTATISNASTDLTLIIGVGYDNDNARTSDPSTITGGLTLTSADGNKVAGWPAYKASGHGAASAGPGVFGYGAGGGTLGDGVFGGANTGQNFTGNNGNDPRVHGFGMGGYASYPHVQYNSGDGAILIYY